MDEMIVNNMMSSASRQHLQYFRNFLSFELIVSLFI